MLPPVLQTLLDQIAACEQDAARLVAGLDDDAVNWRPESGGGARGWSIAQCLSHLAMTNTRYLQGWDEAVMRARTAGSGAFTGLAPTFVGRWFVKTLEPPVTRKVKTFASVTPDEYVSRDQLVSAFAASHDPYRTLVREAATLDVNRVVGPNAFVPRLKMRLSTVLLVIPAHDRRHLWQAANVRRALPGG